jgi:polysaccharide biosynthesis transport protein
MSAIEKAGSIKETGMEQDKKNIDQLLVQDSFTIREMIESIWEGKIIIAIITVITVVLSALMSFFIIPEKYEAQIVIIATPVNFALSDSPVPDKIIENLTRLPNLTIDIYLQQIKSPAVFDRTIKKLALRNKDGRPISINKLASQVTVANTPNTNQIEIKVIDQDAETAVLIINTLVDVYTEYVTEKCSEQIQLVTDLIEQQIAVETRKLDEKSQALTQFWTVNGNIDVLKKEVATLGDQIVSYREDLRDIEALIDSDSETLKSLVSAAKSAGVTNLEDFYLNIDLASDPEDEGGLAKIPEAGKQIQVSLGADSLSWALVSIDINKTQTRLVSNFYKKQALDQKLLEMDAAIAANESLLSRSEYVFNAIKQDMDLAQSAYENYQIKLKKAEMIAAADIGKSNIAISSEAIIPEQPVSPDKLTNLILGIVLGFVLGSCIVLFKVYWKKSK